MSAFGVFIFGGEYPREEWKREVRAQMERDNRFYDRVFDFMAVGPRFTAEQGEELCRRVALLEGKTPPVARVSCRYVDPVE